MNKEKLKDLGVPEEFLDAVFNAVTAEINTAAKNAVKNNGGDGDELKTAKEKIEELEGKLADAEGKLSAAEQERDSYSAKVGEMEKSYAAEKLFDGYKFSSSLARDAAMAKFKDAGLEFADGKYLGGKEWLDGLKKDAPEAFAGDAPAPKLMTGSGGGKDISDEQARAVMGLPVEK